MARWVGDFAARSSKLLETLDEKTSAKISDVRTAASQSGDVSSLLGGGLMSASSGALSSLASSTADALLSIPSTPSRRGDPPATPATVLPSQQQATDEQSESAMPAQRKEQMGLLSNDLNVVLQHGQALHERLQKEGMRRQALNNRVRDLEGALGDATEAAAEREKALRAEIEKLQAREESRVRAIDRGQDERRERDVGRDVELRTLQARLAEQTAAASTAAADSERLKQTLSAQASASASLRDECEASQREVSALQAARQEREQQAAKREGSLEARAAQLSEALALNARTAEAKTFEAERACAELDTVRAEGSREREGREASEKICARLQAELAALSGAGGLGTAEAHALREQLAQSEQRARALAVELEGARAREAEAREAAAAGSTRPSASADRLLALAVAGEGHAASSGASGAAEVEELCAKLAEQQQLVQQLRADRTALKLEAESEKRRRVAEQSQAPGSAARKLSAGADAADLEGGGSTEGFSPARMQLKRRWAHRPNVAKVMEVVDEAAQLIDRGSLQTTRFLSHNPYVRLGVACYGILLHLWVMVVLMHLAPGSRSGRHHHGPHGSAHPGPEGMPAT